MLCTTRAGRCEGLSLIASFCRHFFTDVRSPSRSPVLYLSSSPCFFVICALHPFCRAASSSPCALPLLLRPPPSAPSAPRLRSQSVAEPNLWRPHRHYLPPRRGHYQVCRRRASCGLARGGPTGRSAAVLAGGRFRRWGARWRRRRGRRCGWRRALLRLLTFPPKRRAEPGGGRPSARAASLGADPSAVGRGRGTLSVVHVAETPPGNTSPLFRQLHLQLTLHLHPLRRRRVQRRQP